jgi:hypothetical protein
MKVVMRIFFIMALLFSNSVISAEFAGKVKGFYIDGDGKVLLRLVQYNQNGTANGNSPHCSRAGIWDFEFKLDGDLVKNWWLSMVTSARNDDVYLKVGYPPNNSGLCGISYMYFWEG